MIRTMEVTMSMSCIIRSVARSGVREDMERVVTHMRSECSLSRPGGVRLALLCLFSLRWLVLLFSTNKVIRALSNDQYSTGAEILTSSLWDCTLCTGEHLCTVAFIYFDKHNKLKCVNTMS